MKYYCYLRNVSDVVGTTVSNDSTKNSVNCLGSPVTGNQQPSAFGNECEGSTTSSMTVVGGATGYETATSAELHLMSTQA